MPSRIAAADGAISGLRLAAYVGALLIAFVALIAMANDACAWIGSWFGAEHLTLDPGARPHVPRAFDADVDVRLDADGTRSKVTIELAPDTL
jgi:hypothetical protein